MKTIIRITKDNFSTLSYDMWKEDINYLVNEIDLICKVKNDRFNNIVEDEKNYLGEISDYKNKSIVDAIGYSQSEWQTYILYHNLKEDDNLLNQLIEQLKKSFTHFNDYFVEKFEQEEINGKKFNSEPFDYTSFCINHIEFPEKNDVLKEYNEIYGIDYDKVIIEED